MPTTCFRTLNCVFVGLLSAWAFGAELQLKIVDGPDGPTVQARVRIRDERGVDHAPAGAVLVRLGQRDRWFVSDGRCQVTVPAGSIDLRIEHGTEYRPYRTSLTLTDNTPLAHAAALSRWIDMRQRGYLCGEDHLHVPAAELGPELAAEGLDMGTSLQWWNGPKYDLSGGVGCLGQLSFAGRTMPTSLCDYEIEHSWGAVYVVGMPQALAASSESSWPNLPLLREARAAGALICYQGGWSREVLPDALLGCVDVVNVCNNNFHRHQYQPRSRYSNLLNVPGLPVYPDSPEGMMQLNMESYYRLLNCGLRLAAGAGSATGAKNTPVGYNRAYVRTDGAAGLPGFLEAWRAGRNFVTNGPMLFLKVNRTHQPGNSVALGAEGGEVEVIAEASCEQALTGLEIVHNGEVVARLEHLGTKPEGPVMPARLTAKLRITRGSWLAARCTEEDRLLSDRELRADHEIGGQLPCKPCRLRFAHTSPVYVTVGGRGTREPAAIAEAARMLEAFETFSRRTARGDSLDELLTAITQARTRLNAGS